MKRHDSPKKLYSKITENKKNLKTQKISRYMQKETLCIIKVLVQMTYTGL